MLFLINLLRRFPYGSTMSSDSTTLEAERTPSLILYTALLGRSPFALLSAAFLASALALDTEPQSRYSLRVFLRATSQ